MKTEQLISLLATGEGVLNVPSLARRYGTALGWGIGGAATLMLLLLRVRSDLLQALLLPMFWVKIGFVASLAAGSLFACLRLSRPGARLTAVPMAILIPILGIWTIAAYVLSDATPPEQSRLFFGDTWKSCPLLIAMLSIPLFFMLIRVMRDLAPTQPPLAGFAAGLLAGATAAVVYCFHCPEMGAPFIAFWYLLGTLIPAVVGAWVGHIYLRW